MEGMRISCRENRGMLQIMKCRIAVQFLGILMVLSIHAQTPAACVSQLVPLKPVGIISCTNATPVCLTDPNGLHGTWIWLCNNNATPQVKAPQIENPSVPLVYPPPLRQVVPQVENPMDFAIKAQQLRQLRLQNQQMEQQLNLQQQVATESLAPTAEVPADELPPPPDGHNWMVMKDFEKSMVLWHTIKPKGHFEKQSEKALDRFYSDTANLSVPIADAFLTVSATIK
jgi:hypothetical protein